MLNFVGNTVPAVVADFLKPDKMALLFKATVEGVQFAQAMFGHAPVEVRKKEALEFAVATYDVVDAIFGLHETIDHYVKTILFPSMIDGVIVSFNNSGWFDTSKPVEFGGPNNPAGPIGPSVLPAPKPAFPKAVSREAA